ncbi:hypothetical protein CCAND93_340011 [Capnocytophaga canis]|uniref:Uncharacterized protein n=1 Tax=Capnocytophaga canis TaxID=1848903 RepID=A0A0B7IM63_9FLAO|nr:hypothetical protein CCAND93_340011 [Capnocytophaga canis]
MRSGRCYQYIITSNYSSTSNRNHLYITFVMSPFAYGNINNPPKKDFMTFLGGIKYYLLAFAVQVFPSFEYLIIRVEAVMRMTFNPSSKSMFIRLLFPFCIFTPERSSIPSENLK